MNIALPLAATSCILYLLASLIYRRFFHPLRNIPGPFWASLSRFWLGYQISTGRMDSIQQKLHARYGTLRNQDLFLYRDWFWLGPLVRIAPDEVSVADPSAVKTIYGAQNGFEKTDFYSPWAANITPHRRQLLAAG
ncbi:hypothetical protein BJX70DRAFT_399729 [Aspergillus crustosus]